MKALVLSGGGVRGAYQVGALDYLVKEKKQQYDILCGISVGALNAALMSVFSKTEEIQAVNRLRSIWNNLTTSQVYRRWFPFGKLHSAWKSSVYDSTPLQQLIVQHVDIKRIRQSNRKVKVGAVCLETGEYRLFTEKDDELVQGVAASSAFPGMFCPIKIDGLNWIDGGLKEFVPLECAMQADVLEIDIIISNPVRTNRAFNGDTNALKIAERTVDLMWDELILDNIINNYDKLSIRPKINIIRPDVDLTDSILSFEQKDIQRMINIGYADAKRMYNV